MLTEFATINRGIERMAKMRPNTEKIIIIPFAPHVNRTAASRCCRNPTIDYELVIHTIFK